MIDCLFEIDPKVRVVAASALLEELDSVRAKRGERVRFILKPYDVEHLQGLLALERLG
ncbi:MAG: hypothetical protein J6386_17440 [Candidatus Synoicihabitans palmerolidicus]|nr:hypothetical protein [Candidatus Synoicihabitans palmerolidicus]